MSKNTEPMASAAPQAESRAADAGRMELAKQEGDRSLVPLKAFAESLEGYNGKILLRIPRSLHKRLVEEAKLEGVSLNQYALYKLSQ